MNPDDASYTSTVDYVSLPITLKVIANLGTYRPAVAKTMEAAILRRWDRCNFQIIYSGIDIMVRSEITFHAAEDMSRAVRLRQWPGSSGFHIFCGLQTQIGMKKKLEDDAGCDKSLDSPVEAIIFAL